MSPRELEREAAIIARRLVKRKAWLENLAGAFAIDDKWVIVSAKTVSKAKITPLSEEAIKAMLAECWLISEPTGALRLSAEGAKKLLKIDDGEAFVAQHQNRQPRLIKDHHGRTFSVISNESENPLGWMRARKDNSGRPLLDKVQYEAGEQVRRDFTLARMSARVTASWEFSSPIPGKASRRAEGIAEISDRALAAKQRLFAALDCLGPEMSGVVFEVCCLASGLEKAERQLKWPRRSAKLVLQIALTRLAEHYGLICAKNRKPGSGIIRHWGQEGFRPEIPPAESP